MTNSVQRNSNNLFSFSEGAKLLTGSVLPNIAFPTANDGDIYIRSGTPSQLYQRLSGVWVLIPDYNTVVSLVGGSSSPYIQTFNNSTDWGSPSGGYYSITVLEANHSKGLSPSVSIFEDISGDYIKIEVDRILVNNVGDVVFRVPEIPDTRFVGKIVIL